MNLFKNLFSKPVSTTLKVTSGNGFHLRPVAKFVSVAKTYDCEITASFNNKRVSAKAVNALLSLGLDKDNSFTLTAQGKEAAKALEDLTQTFRALMENDKEVKKMVNSGHHYTGASLQGERIYAGIAIAPLFHYKPTEEYEQNNATFKGAVVNAVSTLTKRSQAEASNGMGDIYLAQKELLLQLSSKVQDLPGFTSLIEEEMEALRGTKLESKSADYQDLLHMIKSYLGYRYDMQLPQDAFILLADDLLPSDIAKLQESSVKGVILKHTSPTSHTAILLRAADIPSLILGEQIDAGKHEVILDANAAVLVTHPSDKDLQDAQEVRRSETKQKASDHAKRFDDAITKDNTCIAVYANVTDTDSAQAAKEEGAQGIGLLRTEFLFTAVEPDVAHQMNAYKEIFSLFEDVTVRTLDVGGDKALPYITLAKEENPFLGIRGVRLLETHPEILERQLHAIFLAAQGRQVKIMFPMVSSVEEFVHAKTFAHNVAKKYAISIDHILFGIMIEVPSVLFLLKEFDQVVDFYSVGTNDLTQYLFAIERTHPTLSADTLSPVVFAALDQIVTTVTKPVSICGELASNPKAVERLIGLGYHTLSITPKSIPHIKETIRHV